jgi:hypothetical protein
MDRAPDSVAIYYLLYAMMITVSIMGFLQPSIHAER